jgi:hypothetical protein
VPNSDEELRGLTSDRYNNTYLVGASTLSGQGPTFVVGRFNADRSLAWHHRETPLTVGLFTPTEVAVDSNTGNVYVVGSPNGSRDNRYMLYCFYQAPVATSDNYRTKMNERLVVPVSEGLLANDQFGPRGTVSRIPGLMMGELDLAPDGSFTYTPPTNQFGVATFRYRLTRPDLTVSESVVSINILQPDPPVLQND